MLQLFLGWLAEMTRIFWWLVKATKQIETQAFRWKKWRMGSFMIFWKIIELRSWKTSSTPVCLLEGNPSVRFWILPSSMGNVSDELGVDHQNCLQGTFFASSVFSTQYRGCRIHMDTRQSEFWDSDTNKTFGFECTAFGWRFAELKQFSDRAIRVIELSLQGMLLALWRASPGACLDLGPLGLSTVFQHRVFWGMHHGTIRTSTRYTRESD